MQPAQTFAPNATTFLQKSDIHRRCMTYLIDALARHFEKRGSGDVYVSGNMFLYHERGNRRAVVAPDVFVVMGAPAHLRDSYLLWNEPKGPDFVLEVTSASTRRADEGRKREVYAALGVSEYFLRIPEQSDHRFHGKVITDSIPK